MLFSTQVRLGHAQMGDAHSFTPVVQGAVADFYATLGHPGSWPANWVFALRHGVTPDRFDELYGRVPRDRLAMRVGSPEEGAALGRGWSRVEEGETGRWAEGEDATLLPTLTAPADRTLRLRGAAARHPGGLAQIVEVEVNGQRGRSGHADPRGAILGGAGPRGPLAAGPQRDPLPRGVAPVEEGSLGGRSAAVRRLAAGGDHDRARP